MENATKALLMAGSLLLSLLVIGAVVFVYRDLSSVQKENEETKKVQQTAEFNRGYTSFEKQLYGSELLSLVNKAIDYDEKIEIEQSGYAKITIVIDVKKASGSFIDINIYPVNNSNNIFKTRLDTIEVIKTKYNGDQYLQRLSSALSSNKETEFKKILDENLGMDITNNAIVNKAKAEVQMYTDYIEFKRKKFKHVETKYDDNKNGRITEMKFEEVIL